jgi:hypothetical protein
VDALVGKILATLDVRIQWYLMEPARRQMESLNLGFDFDCAQTAIRSFLWSQVITGGLCHRVPETLVKLAKDTKNLAGQFTDFLNREGHLSDGRFAAALMRRAKNELGASESEASRKLADRMAKDFVDLARKWHSGTLRVTELLEN